MMPAAYQSGTNPRVPTIAVQQPSLPMAGMSGMNPNELEARAHLEQQNNGYNNNEMMEPDQQGFDDYDEEDFHAQPTSTNRAAALNYGTGGGRHSASSSFRM